MDKGTCGLSEVDLTDNPFLISEEKTADPTKTLCIYQTQWQNWSILTVGTYCEDLFLRIFIGG